MKAKDKFDNRIIYVRPMLAEIKDDPSNIERFIEVDEVVFDSSFLKEVVEELHNRLLESSGLHANSDMLAMFIHGYHYGRMFGSVVDDNAAEEIPAPKYSIGDEILITSFNEIVKITDVMYVSERKIYMYKFDKCLAGKYTEEYIDECCRKMN